MSVGRNRWLAVMSAMRIIEPRRSSSRTCRGYVLSRMVPCAAWKFVRAAFDQGLSRKPADLIIAKRQRGLLFQGALFSFSGYLLHSVRINNSLYHPFASLTRDTEGTENTWLFFEFLCVLCVSVVKGFLWMTLTWAKWITKFFFKSYTTTERKSGVTWLCLGNWIHSDTQTGTTS